MHLSCKCASEFAPEGQLRLQLAPFLRTSRRGVAVRGNGDPPIELLGNDLTFERVLERGFNHTRQMDSNWPTF